MESAGIGMPVVAYSLRFEVTVEKLRMIDQGEEIMRGLGFRQTRVRHHGDIARIEIARDEVEGA